MTHSKNAHTKIPLWVFLFLLIFISGRGFAQLVTNGGFEDSGPGVVGVGDVNGWLLLSSEVSPAPAFEITDTDAQEGNRALKVTVQGIGTNPWDIQAVAEHIPVEPEVTYTYTVWAKAEKPGAQAAFTIGNYSYSEYNALRSAELTTEWKKFTLQFMVNDNQTDIRAPIHLSLDANIGNTIYIDNLQITDTRYGAKPVIVEAESGQAGDYFTEGQDGDITWVTTTASFTGQASPEDTNRVITYQVAFQDTGYYNLFARVRVGSGGYDDDSFFAGNGFGEKNSATAADWVFINGLASAGFSSPEEFVDETGKAGSNVWKWINVTKNYFPGTAPDESFYVGSDTLTKTFQIASREDGLQFDKFAFGKAELYYTVDALDNGLPGKTTMEVDSSNFYQGPPLAEGASKFLGNVMASDNIFANYWNQITPGNEGKWGSIAYTSNIAQWNWSGLDRIYTYAKDHDLIFKDHTLIWGQQQPSWISDMDTATQRNYIEAWIKRVGERYPEMDMVDVVNEPLRTHNPPDGRNNRADYKEALGGDGETGWDWVITSFQLARKYIPDAMLLLNDYGIINDNNATTLYLEIIALLQERGLIDGIGVQGHRFALENTSNATLKYNLDRLAATGLPVYISELDLGNIGNQGTPDDDVQLQLYQRIFPLLWEHPGVQGINLWGYVEGEMWQSSCYLVLRDGTWRPAMQWLYEYIQDNLTGTKEIYRPLSGILLEQNYPNPFSSITHIPFSIPEPMHVTLTIYDISGRKVSTLINEKLTPGTYRVAWNSKKNGSGSSLSGTFIYKLVAGNRVITRKMLCK
jgi:endo-1,4-beta-xylanase